MLRVIQLIQLGKLVGWVERKQNPSPAIVVMGFAMLNPSYGYYGYGFELLNRPFEPEH